MRFTSVVCLSLGLLSASVSCTGAFTAASLAPKGVTSAAVSGDPTLDGGTNPIPNPNPDPNSTPNPQPGATATPTPPPAVYKGDTYSSSVGTIFAQHCASCHARKDGIAPFPLENYNDISAHAQGIRAAVANRTMPPPGVDNSGSCQTFSNALWLTDDTVQKITSWIDAGLPRGDAAFDPGLPTHPGLANVNTTVAMPAAYTPAPASGEIDDYRCFVIDPQVTADTLVTALEVHPGQAAEVHHIIVFKPTTAAAQASAEAKSGTDGRPGYSCFGSAGVASSIMGLWAPGARAGEMADPSTGQPLGLRLEAGRKLILQVHYNTQNGASADQSSIALKFNAAAKPVKWLLLADFLLNLPAGQDNIPQSSTQSNRVMQFVSQEYESGAKLNLATLLSLTLPPARDMTVYTVGPHMHKLGKDFKLERINSAGQSTCMATVPKFSFNWQAGYAFSQPFSLASTDKLKINCSFSTVGRTSAVKFGEGTSDEMCLAFLLVNE